MPAITRRGVSACIVAGPAQADLESAARAEGSLTWYVAQMSGKAAEAIGRRFTEKHAGIAVSVIRTTGQVPYQRLQQELKNNTPNHCSA